jgi:hypothetical protein
MTRMFMIWAILSVVIYFGILTWREFSGLEKWHLTKLVAYATLCSLLSVLVLSIFVFLF